MPLRRENQRGMRAEQATTNHDASAHRDSVVELRAACYKAEATVRFHHRCGILGDMRVLVGSTGFIGTTLARSTTFDVAVHRADLERIAGMCVDEIVCAGLPAEKWRANQDPATDWTNVCRLADVLSSVQATRFVLISTIDVYQPPIGVDEQTPAQLQGSQAYGRNRAWFEWFCRGRFPGCTIVRLPGMFGVDLRKNLIFDLLEERSEQWAQVSARSSFQFFDAEHVWDIVQAARTAEIDLLNVATEPVGAGDVAALFGVTLSPSPQTVHYDMRTVHASKMLGSGDYLVSRDDVLESIDALRVRWRSA